MGEDNQCSDSNEEGEHGSEEKGRRGADAGAKMRLVMKGMTVTRNLLRVEMKR